MSRSDFTVFWATINLGWFFLLRAGEYLKHDGMDWDHNKVLVGANVDLVLEDGASATMSQTPIGVSVRIVGSKTDVYNVGQIRKHFRSGDGEGVCPVEALAALRHAFPQRFGSGSEAHLPPVSMDQRAASPPYPGLLLAGAGCGCPGDPPHEDGEP